MSKKGSRRTHSRRLTGQQMSVSGEVSYITGLANQRTARVVSLGPLVFFSTQSGDAWVLDAADALALQLSQDGDRLPARVIETPERYMIEWEATFRIAGDAFICLDSGNWERAIMGYPIVEIRNAINRVKAQ
jgi:hypothetical protein